MHFKTNLSWEWAEVSKVKSAKIQMTIHIDYDREENKIESILAFKLEFSSKYLGLELRTDF